MRTSARSLYWTRKAVVVIVVACSGPINVVAAAAAAVGDESLIKAMDGDCKKEVALECQENSHNARRYNNNRECISLGHIIAAFTLTPAPICQVRR